jgi:hypothetical protein
MLMHTEYMHPSMHPSICPAHVHMPCPRAVLQAGTLSTTLGETTSEERWHRPLSACSHLVLGYGQWDVRIQEDPRLSVVPVAHHSSPITL